MLRKYIANPSHVLGYEPLQLTSDLTYEEKPVQILDQKEKVLRNKRISLVKVLWKNQSVEGATWETEQEMQSKYPELFGKLNFEDEILYRGRIVMPNSQITSITLHCINVH